MIDLQGHATVDTIEIDHDPAAYIAEYVIETSPNGWEWTEYVHVTGATGADTTHIAPGGGVDGVRFVRLTAVARGTQWGNSIYELSVYGTGWVVLAPPSAEGARGVLLSYLKPGTASTEQDDAQCAGCTVANLFDRNTITRWATDPAATWEGNPSWDGTAWVQVDLGAPAVVQQIALYWDPAYATSYDVFVADDATGPWRQIYGTSTGDGVRDIFDIDDEPGRYVRLVMNERAWVWGAQYGYSLYEFRVYGTGGDPITPPPLPQDPDFGDLELVWSDEFSGATGTAADPTKWVSDPSATWTVNNRELQLYTDGTHNVRHDGQGHLLIEAKRENYQGAQLYTSGRINTSQTFHGQYGRYEARIKVPQGQGLWPAFWMMGGSFLEGTPWPSNGEIDIMEVLGHDTQTTHTTIHGPGYSGMGGVGGGHHAGVDLSADFHVYGVDWDSTGLTYTLDGAPIFRIDREDVEEGRGQNWVYDQPFYMILNLAVGGEWPGNPDSSTQFPATMLVDYVRVWQSPGSGDAQVLTPPHSGGTPPATGGATPPPPSGAGTPAPGRTVTVYVTPEPQPAPSEEPSVEPAPETAPDVDPEDGSSSDGGTGPSAPGTDEAVEAEPVAASPSPFTSVLPWLLGAGAGVLAGVGGSWFAWRRGL